MEQTIHPEALKTFRKKRGWSQKELADKCGCNTAQVSRWERGHSLRLRSNLRERLPKALGVSWEDLSCPPKNSADPEQASAAVDEALGRVQLNVRVNRSDSNALQLVCLRYNIRPADVIRLAPLLFLIIAEKSLAHRQANLDAIKEKLSQLENDSGAAAPHLRTEFAYRPGLVEQALSSEQDSIKQRDVFGHHVQLENADYDTFAELNTFLDYLKILMADIPPNLVSATTWEWRGSIDYDLAEDTLREVTGISGETHAEQKILAAILEGDINLKEVLSRKKTQSQEEYLSWLPKAIEAAKSRGPAVKREAFAIAKKIVENAIREQGLELADFDTDKIERLAIKVIADKPDITKEAERRVDQLSKMDDQSFELIGIDLLSADPISASIGENS